MKNLTKRKVCFYKGDHYIEFDIWTNLPDGFGVSFDAAMKNWLYRTDNYTAESFCSYINSKPVPYIALTEKQYVDNKISIK